jgi:hypothetical protein
LPGASESTVETRPQSNGRTNGAAESAFAASVALAMAALFGEALQPGKIEPAVGAIAAALGLAIGAVLGGLRRVMSRLPGRTRTMFWIGSGAVLGLWPALAIGAVAKLSGTHSTMAAASLAAGTLGGAAVGAYLSLGQPGPDGAALTDRSPVVVVSVSFALLVMVAASVVDDSLLVLRSYPPVRAAISVVAALAAAHAGIALSRALGKHLGSASVTAVRWSLWLLLVSSGVVAAARLSEERAAPLLTRPIAGRLLALARTATDFDRDGSSQWFAGGDCAPFDGKVGPRAREIPGNGIDDNCSFGDARPRHLDADAVATRLRATDEPAPRRLREKRSAFHARLHVRRMDVARRTLDAHRPLPAPARLGSSRDHVEFSDPPLSVGRDSRSGRNVAHEFVGPGSHAERDDPPLAPAPRHAHGGGPHVEAGGHFRVSRRRSTPRSVSSTRSATVPSFSGFISTTPTSRTALTMASRPSATDWKTSTITTWRLPTASSDG